MSASLSSLVKSPGLAQETDGGLAGGYLLHLPFLAALHWKLLEWPYLDSLKCECGFATVKLEKPSPAD